jgi:hypothetical protein
LQPLLLNTTNANANEPLICGIATRRHTIPPP